MKIGTILASTDINPLYSDFIPIFIKAWNKILPNANVIIVLIANEIPDNLKEFEKNIRLFKPIPDIKSAFISQCIRILYPREIDTNDGVLISDIDMIPMNQKYYVEPIKNIDNSTFISYRDVLGSDQIAICYNVATPNIWKDMIGNEDTITILKKWYPTYNGTSGGRGWYTDQEKLAEYYKKYNGKKIMLNDSITGFNRLDRINNISISDTLKKDIQNAIYSDYHCMRPYSENKEINEFVLNSIPQYGGKRKRRTIKKYNKKRRTQKFKRQIGGNNDETQCKYIDIYGVQKNIDKMNKSSIKYVKTDNLNSFIIPNEKFILVTGTSDLTIPDDFKEKTEEILKSQNLIHWYAQNINTKLHNKLSHIPIGLDYHTSNETPLNQEKELINIQKKMKPFINRENKVYINFSKLKSDLPSRYGDNDRKKVYEQIPENLVYIEESRLSRNDTWNNMIKYAFVASPHGNGLDCHRTWEALVLGCIPIVKKSNIDPLYDNLPVLIVNNWSDINEKLLKNTIDKFKNNKFNMDKLTLQYWMDLILKNTNKSKHAIALCSNKGYLDKAEKTISEIRTKGEYSGDIVFLHDEELHDDKDLNELKDKYNLILKEFPKIDTSIPEKLNKSDYKIFQYFKFYLFDTYFKSWNTVLYIDAGMHIFKSLNRFFDLDVKNKFMAHSDTYPTYEWKLDSQFNLDIDPEITKKLKNNFNIDKKDYFQSTMMLYDTSIIKEDSVKKLIELMNTYPNTFGTKDQAILNLYFMDKWTPLPIKDNTGLLYDFNERDNKKEDYIMVKYPKK